MDFKLLLSLLEIELQSPIKLFERMEKSNRKLGTPKDDGSIYNVYFNQKAECWKQAAKKARDTKKRILIIVKTFLK